MTMVFYRCSFIFINPNGCFIYFNKGKCLPFSFHYSLLSPSACIAQWHLPRLPTLLLTKMMDVSCPLGSITFVYTGAHLKAALF